MNVLHQMCHLPVEQTKDQRRTTFFGAVRDEAGSSLSDEKNPRPLGRGACQLNIKSIQSSAFGPRDSFLCRCRGIQR